MLEAYDKELADGRDYIQRNGSTGKPELYCNYAADEEPPDAVFGKGSQQSVKSIVPERKQGTDRNDRPVHGWLSVYDAEAGNRGNVKRSQSTEEGWKR